MAQRRRAAGAAQPGFMQTATRLWQAEMQARREVAGVRGHDGSYCFPFYLMSVKVFAESITMDIKALTSLSPTGLSSPPGPSFVGDGGG